MGNKFKYRLAVQGKQNFTPIGPAFETPYDAVRAAPEINAERESQGLKPVVALKRYAAGRWEFLYYLQRDDDEDKTDKGRENAKM